MGFHRAAALFHLCAGMAAAALTMSTTMLLVLGLRLQLVLTSKFPLQPLLPDTCQLPTNGYQHTSNSFTLALPIFTLESHAASLGLSASYT